MKDLGKPVNNKRDKIEKAVKEVLGDQQMPKIDFQNTEVAFAHKSDEELKKMAWLFGMMNKPWLVNVGSKLGLAAIKLRLPFAEGVLKQTIFQQFCGGTTLLETQKTIDKLHEFNTLTILDYGAEGKETEDDFNQTMNETMRAIEFAAHNAPVPVVSTKVTGIARFELLESIGKSNEAEFEHNEEYQNVLKRMDTICHVASHRNVGVFFDAEESWIQDGIDHFVNRMMARYNKTKVTVYNTFQLYRKDRLQYLLNSYERAKSNGYLLGAKLVRGAYMEKERARAAQIGYPSPIHDSKAATDHSYDTAVKFCVKHYETIASCNATHNLNSNLLQAQLIAEMGIDKNHSHLNFCQLYGMSDNLTFNLAKAGYNVAKYVPYGPVRDVVPYLIRRAQENTSVTGEVSREHELILGELKRRSLKE